MIIPPQTMKPLLRTTRMNKQLRIIEYDGLQPSVYLLLISHLPDSCVDEVRSIIMENGNVAYRDILLLFAGGMGDLSGALFEIGLLR